MFDKRQEVIEFPLLAPRPWEVIIPASKSLTNRALHLAALAEGKSLIKNPLQAIDTKIMRQLWTHLGCAIKNQGQDLELDGCAGCFSSSAKKELYVENAGTAARFVTAALVLSSESFSVSGDEYMDRRPFDGLIKALEALGGKFAYSGQKYCTPFTLTGSEKHFIYPTSLEVCTKKSSQFVSALLMVAPLLPKGLKVLFPTEALSKPYIFMTLEMMRKFGASFEKIHGGFKFIQALTKLVLMRWNSTIHRPPTS